MILLLVAVMAFNCFAVPASAIAVVDDLALAAIAALAACGMTFVFAGLSQSGAIDRVKGLLSDYMDSIGDDGSNWLVSGALSMYGGKIRMASQLAARIYDFAQWLKSEYNISDNSSSVISSISGGEGFLLADGSIFSMLYAPSLSDSFTYDINFVPVVIPFNSVVEYNFANGAKIDCNITYDHSIAVFYPDGKLAYSWNYSNAAYGGSFWYSPDGTSIHLWRIDINNGNYIFSRINRYDTNLIDVFGDTVSADSESVGIDAGTITIPDSIAAEADVLLDVAGVPGVVTLDTALEYVGAAAIDGTLEVSHEVVEDLPPVVEDLTGDYTIDLTSFFPFCIPFDIYDAVTMLNGTPEAPNFRLGFEWLGQDFGIDVDLSPWDDVAVILRRMEVLAFIVGLGVATRKFIKW